MKRGRPRKNPTATATEKPTTPATPTEAPKAAPDEEKLHPLWEKGAAQLRKGILEAVEEVAIKYGPILARLAAADTMHTSQSPDVVFARAIKEGLIAGAMLNSEEVLKRYLEAGGSLTIKL